MEEGISPTRQATGNSAFVRGFFSAGKLTTKPSRQILWIATSDWLTARRIPPPMRTKSQPSQEGSCRFILSCESAQGLLRFSYFFQRQLSGFHQVRHDRLRTPPEQVQQVINQPTVRRLAREDGFEDVRVADFLDSAQHLLAFHAVHRGLHRGIGRAAPLGKRFLNLADRGRATAPKRFHNLKFQLRQFGQVHESFLLHSLVCLPHPYLRVKRKARGLNRYPRALRVRRFCFDFANARRRQALGGATIPDLRRAECKRGRNIRRDGASVRDRRLRCRCGKSWSSRNSPSRDCTLELDAPSACRRAARLKALVEWQNSANSPR